jgi:hypothetical protein
MEQAEIRALLEKYWDAETTLEEEQRLADYFRRPEIDPSLEEFRSLFIWREEEARLVPGEGFDERLLQVIGAMAGDPAKAVVRRFSFGYSAAAAILVCIVISFFLMISGPGSAPIRSVAVKPPSTAAGPDVRTVAEIKDTYDDPQKALAAIRHALLFASTGISKGRHITQKNITRFHNSLKAVTGD